MIIEPLKNATQKLSEGLIRYQKDTSDEQIRDGLIQRFEFTYELSHKILKRYLETISPTPDVIDKMAFSDMIRTANEYGLLCGNWSDWRVYREMRNLTSHSYNEQKALQVVANIPKFLTEVEFLLNELTKRLINND
ncbi:MAG: nucleotidyltransferase substrate binding protein [Moraxella sp.]|uniref:nucleotidyltransferase substrate binding protein n=1 Tax=Moraxella sp. TaxID=479 RepID=UPI0026DDC9F1|nr:nucleotidyltransferase substrate binding protein [Moraxella sp.]MDO4450212.1 nucleotidyltransferase substrate binding protein [Moraxella sp.]